MTAPRHRPTPADPASAGVGHDPDQRLLERIRAGDGPAYSQLLDRHLDRIHGLAVRMLGNPADAEEVAQDTFIKAWQQIPDWTPGQAKFSTWLYRVAMNLCHDSLRRRRPTQPLDSIDPRSDVPGPEARADARDRSANVRRALAALPERQREAIILSHFQELSQREAAQVLDVSERALESLLARGRRALRALLSASDFLSQEHPTHVERD